MKRRKTLSMTRQEDDMNGNGLEKRYRANGNYVYREIAGEGVLIPSGDLPGNVMVTVN